MAEAAVQEEQRSNKFFCHQCSVEINPKIPEYTCPRCDSGFIEEVTETFVDDQEQENPVDPAAEFAELWGRTFLESFRLHADPSRAGGGGADADSGDEDDEGGQRQPQIRVLPSTRISIRRTPAGLGPGQGTLQNIIEQLLSGLTGGAMMGGGADRGPMPFGINLPVYGNPGDYAWGSGGLDNIISQLLNQLEGTGPPPAPKDEIDKLKTCEISQAEVDKGVQCSVCMEDFKLEEIVKELPCNHLYHPDCIVPWLEMHGTCPICRKTLDGDVCDEHGNPVTNNSNTDSNPGPSTIGGSNLPTGGNTDNNQPSSSSNSRVPDFSEEYD